VHHIVVIGGNFSGLTSALELKRRLGYACKVTLISKQPYFLFVPSLIWIPFGKRELADIAIPLAAIATEYKIELICAEATEILPAQNTVKCHNKNFTYDYLIIATGPNWLLDQVDGMGLDSNISYITSYSTAMKMRERWHALMQKTGPIIVGATQGCQFISSAYEFLFNMEKQCRNLGIRDRLDITFITPEPYIGHLGMGDICGSHFYLKRLFSKLGINYLVNTEIKKVTQDTLILNNGSLPYQFCMLMPKSSGAQVIKNSIGLGTEDGLLPVKDTYQHQTYPNIFGVGSAIDYATTSTLNTKAPVGITKTGYAAHVSAKTAVKNIVHLINKTGQLVQKSPTRLPEFLILDAGDKELFAFAFPLLKPRVFSVAFPNVFNDFGKVAVEKYILWQKRKGYSWLLP